MRLALLNKLHDIGQNKIHYLPPPFLSFRCKLSVFTTTFFLPREANLILRKFCETERKHPLTLILPNKLFYLRAKTNIIIYPWCLWFFHILLGKFIFFSQFNWNFFRFCASHSQFGLSQEKNLSFCASHSQFGSSQEKNSSFCASHCQFVSSQEKNFSFCASHRQFGSSQEKNFVFLLR